MIRETPVAEASGADARGGRQGTAVPLTRIYIDPEGNLVVTDLWEEVAHLVGEAEGSCDL